MLKVCNVTKKFGTKVAVEDLSFELDKGKIIGLLGQNGAGKTTTFRMILNILNMTEGTITFNEKSIENLDYTKIGFLTEERSLISTYSVFDQLLFFAELKGMNKKNIIEKIDYWLEVFNLLDTKNKKIKELSKGNQQKVQFISSFLHEPELLILDEPFSGLDPFNINIFKKAILKLKDKGTMVIFSSHRLDHVELFCNNVIVLVNGKTVLQGSIDKLKKDSDFFKVEIIGDIDKKKLENFSFISELRIDENKYNFIMENYENIKELNKIIKSGNKIERFMVNIPTFEEIFVKKVGEFYE
ncbi:MAG: ABC transporter ATP-binding protein [Bacilli bacterium]